jgi:hypothetical protein
MSFLTKGYTPATALSHRAPSKEGSLFLPNTYGDNSNNGLRITGFFTVARSGVHAWWAGHVFFDEKARMKVQIQAHTKLKKAKNA